MIGNILLYSLYSFIATFGFAIIFNIKGKKLSDGQYKTVEKLYNYAAEPRH